MADTLQKLFGSIARVKLLRIFLFNPKTSYTVPEVAQLARIKLGEARREVTLLLKIKLIKRARRPARSLGKRFILADDFEYRQALHHLLLNAPAYGAAIPARIRRAGTLKLVVLSGIFVGEWEGRLDLLIVGERINERSLQKRIRTLESELGKELRYATLTSQDFAYRLNMSDHLLRDILDFPHRIVLDKLNLSLK